MAKEEDEPTSCLQAARAELARRIKGNDCVAQPDFIANLAGLVNNIDVVLDRE